jgi:hypothetical protein
VENLVCRTVVENERRVLTGTPPPARTCSRRTAMSSIYPIGLPSSGDPFSDMPIVDEELITERDEMEDDEFVDDDDALDDDDIDIDIARGDGPVLDEDDDLL